MQLNCPTCHGELELAGTMAHCATCNKDMEVNAACPECHQPLEVLKACGAVDYFCQHGHGLISKNESNSPCAKACRYSLRLRATVQRTTAALCSPGSIAAYPSAAWSR